MIGRHKAQEPFVPDAIDIEVGQRIRIARKRRHVSQASLGLSLGVSFQQIQKYERAANRVSASMLVKISRVLGVRVSDLVGEAASAPDGELAALLAAPQALELLDAFAQLKDAKLRAAVLSLAASLANSEKA